MQISKRVFQENKARQICRQTNPAYTLICTRTKNKYFIPPDTTCTCAYQRVRNVRFSENFASLCFLERPVLRFARLAYLRRIVKMFSPFLTTFLIMCLTTKENQNIKCILCHWSLMIPPENIRKPEFFWCFQEISKEISGMKWVNNKKSHKYSKATITQPAFTCSKLTIETL